MTQDTTSEARPTAREDGAASGRGPTLVILAAGRATRYGGVKPLAPVGPAGEAVIDVLASDAVAAGFADLVLVVGPETGPAIRYHVERTWPSGIHVEFAVQAVPRGTVDAVVTAASHLEAGRSFAVANADDLPGVGALALLAEHLTGADRANALVSFRLADSLVGDAPVTRGVADVDGDGFLCGLDERRQVTPRSDGRIVANDGRDPVELGPDRPVSMNLWAFRPHTLQIFEKAMATPGDGEVLLPDVVGDVLAGRRAASQDAGRYRVLAAPGRCIGVTHPGDVALVHALLTTGVGRGDRAAQLWAASTSR